MRVYTVGTLFPAIGVLFDSDDGLQVVVPRIATATSGDGKFHNSCSPLCITLLCLLNIHGNYKVVSLTEFNSMRDGLTKISHLWLHIRPLIDL